MAKSPANEPKRAGRGLVAIAGAKAWFILTSYAIQLGLPRLLDSAAEFGLYKAALSGVSILNNVLIVATIQSVSKQVSEQEDAAPALLRQALRIQLVLGGVLAASLYVSAPLLAGFLLDASLVPLLRIGCVVVLAYAVYGALVGVLNGRRLFSRQATLDVSFSTLRAIGIIGGAALGFGAFGALAGWGSAAIAVTLLAVVLTRSDLFGSGGSALPLRRWLSFMAPIWIYQACLNGVLLLDLQVLKRTLAEMSIAAGIPSAEAALNASQYVGYYGAAQTFAFVPYQLILALTFVIFPMVSRATAAGDREAAQHTIKQAMRFSLLVLLSIAAPVAGAADGVMLIAYPAEYVVGGSALAILIFGVVAFALFVICATVLSSAGRPTLAAIVAGVAVAVVVLSGRFLILASGGGAASLPAVATGTSVGMGVAFVLAASVVYAQFRALFHPLTVLRAAIAAALAWVTAYAIPHQTRLMALVALVVGFLAFGLALALLREITRRDLDGIRNALRSR
ncbi:MAG: hypothetical protein AAGE52_22640 [Myxococcota bacterium]